VLPEPFALANPGTQTCYVNSGLQALQSLRQFVGYCRDTASSVDNFPIVNDRRMFDRLQRSLVRDRNDRSGGVGASERGVLVVSHSPGARAHPRSGARGTVLPR
jgi:hypothetical protein